MKEFNKGLVYTNNNCIGCNKCISLCPVIGANVSVFKNGRNFIEVDEHKCIHCGNCIDVCVHNARDYIDDTNDFFRDLAAGEHISVAVAPSFYLLYQENAEKILGYLRSLGVWKIYDVAFGADIAVWCHLDYFDKTKTEDGTSPAFITQACPAVTNYAENCAPELIPFLIPVQSPVICLGIYVHKYLHDNSKIAFLNPCIAKKDDIDSPQTHGVISYNVTFKHLQRYLDDADIEQYSAKTDLPAIGFGPYFPVPGGFARYLGYFTADTDTLLSSDGLPVLTENRDTLLSFCNKKDHPLLIDMLKCPGGCSCGSGSVCRLTEKGTAIPMQQPMKRIMADNIFRGDKTVSERRRIMAENFAHLDPGDFVRQFDVKYQPEPEIPGETYDKIFASMYKDTREKQTVNCCSCGYTSCHDMATAIAYGYNRRENCVHYAKEEIVRLCYVDTLTGISNETAFMRDCADLISIRNEKYMICVADINNFKVVNDVYSFEVGNKVLQYIANMFKEFVEGIGTCARLGADKFVMCIPYTTENVQKLQRNEYYIYTQPKLELRITVSFGFSIVEDADQDIFSAIDYATLALSQATNRGRNSFTFYSDAMKKSLLLETEITSQMYDALADGEFTVYLQPQYNHSTGALAGAEVLCRWIKSDGTVMSPGIFIPIFEKNGFIRELDIYMWRQSFLILRQWLDDGIEPVPVSVNISRFSLFNAELPSVFAEMLDEYKVPPQLLHLEITESAYMDNQALIIRTVTALHELGFDIAMDDFGSGYSSLNTLKDIPIDILKLDMGFLRGTGNADKGGNIISAVIRMAQSLKLSTIAEGVETVEQADYLRSFGCDIIQGYLYAKPMPASAYRQLLQSADKRQIHFDRPKFTAQIDINGFFNPDAVESKMFDNYIGPAALLEYQDGTMNVIRINGKYLETLGMSRTAFEDARVRLSGALLPETKRRMMDAIQTAVETGEETVCVTERILPGRPEPVWLKQHYWHIFSSGNRHIVYCSIENISNGKNPESDLETANKQM